jgi:two-component system alkaline phosphatase synthesis response regulator PhoP
VAKILIAEDDRAVRSLIRLTLDSGQTQILEVEDGKGALEVAYTELPELIFLDWSMPGSDGLAVCRALRGEPRTAHIKIVMLTARSDDSDRQAALEAGADDYITKPFSPLELLDKVTEVLGPDALIARP